MHSWHNYVQFRVKVRVQCAIRDDGVSVQVIIPEVHDQDSLFSPINKASWFVLAVMISMTASKCFLCSLSPGKGGFADEGAPFRPGEQSLLGPRM